MKRKYIIALCVVMLLSGCSALPEETLPQPDQELHAHYNQRNPWNSSVSYGLTETKGGDLTQQQLSGILPEDAPEWMSATGFYKVYWLHTGEGLQRLEELDYVHLELTTTLQEENIRLIISRDPPNTADIGGEEDIPSVCNGIEYWLYEYTLEGAVRTNLQAHARIGGYWFRFSANPKPEDVPAVKEDMKAVLRSFAYLEKPELSFLDPESKLAYPISWTPVYNEHRCGLLASRSLPEGTIRRELTGEEIATIVPAILRVEMEIGGYGYFREDGSVYYLVLRMKLEDNDATVLFGPGVDWGSCCLSLCLEKGREKSVCGNAEYTLFQKERPNGKSFIAHGRLNEVPVLVRIESRDPDRDRVSFEKILEALSWYNADDLQLDHLKP